MKKMNSKVKIIVREPEMNLKNIHDEEILSPGLSDQVGTMELFTQCSPKAFRGDKGDLEISMENVMRNCGFEGFTEKA